MVKTNEKLMLKYGDITDVGVIAYINKNGDVRPLYIVWEDSESGTPEKYKIDKIIDFKQVVPNHYMWNVLIRNRVVNLHYARASGIQYIQRTQNNISS